MIIFFPLQNIHCDRSINIVIYKHASNIESYSKAYTSKLVTFHLDTCLIWGVTQKKKWGMKFCYETTYFP